jgi:hypothetical protein
VEKGATVQKMNAAIKTDENKRLIVILTSHFEIDQDKFDDV